MPDLFRRLCRNQALRTYAFCYAAYWSVLLIALFVFNADYELGLSPILTPFLISTVILLWQRWRHGTTKGRQ